MLGTGCISSGRNILRRVTDLDSLVNVLLLNRPWGRLWPGTTLLNGRADVALLLTAPRTNKVLKFPLRLFPPTVTGNISSYLRHRTRPRRTLLVRVWQVPVFPEDPLQQPTGWLQSGVLVNCMS